MTLTEWRESAFWWRVRLAIAGLLTPVVPALFLAQSQDTVTKWFAAVMALLFGALAATAFMGARNADEAVALWQRITPEAK